MIVVYRGDDRDKRLHYVCGVEPASKSNLQYRESCLSLGKIVHRNRGDLFEETWHAFELASHDEIFRGAANDRRDPAEIRRRNLAALSLYSFFDTNEVRGSVQRRLIAAPALNGFDHGRGRTLPVRAGHDNGLEAPLGIAEGFQQRLNSVQSVFGRQHFVTEAIQIVERFLVIHLVYERVYRCIPAIREN